MRKATKKHLRELLREARSLGRDHFEQPGSGFQQPPGVLVQEAEEEFDRLLCMHPDDGHRMLWGAILLRAHELHVGYEIEDWCAHNLAIS